MQCPGHLAWTDCSSLYQRLNGRGRSGLLCRTGQCCGAAQVAALQQLRMTEFTETKFVKFSVYTSPCYDWRALAHAEILSIAELHDAFGNGTVTPDEQRDVEKMRLVLDEMTPPVARHAPAPQAAEKMQVTVIGGTAWFVATLEQVLSASGCFSLAAAADCALDGLKQMTSRNSAIVLISARVFDGDIAQVIRRIRQTRPSSRVVLHLQPQRPAQMRDAMQSGAWGLCLHDDPPDVVMSVLKSVAAGRLSFPYVDLSELDDDPFEQLSGREFEVLQALARGWSNMQISSRLGISENTVKYHLKLIYEKLGVPNRATAVARFMARHPV